MFEMEFLFTLYIFLLGKFIDDLVNEDMHSPINIGLYIKGYDDASILKLEEHTNLLVSSVVL